MRIQPESLAHLPVAPLHAGLDKALAQHHCILTAPTGSGKTTGVPLALLESPWLAGRKIVMLEPRRLAARTAARWMSRLLGEEVGTTVGYRTRYESKVGPTTMIEVITEGILIRQLQTDPELADIGLVIFDEFHERSLQADIGLALCLDLCQLRDDLRLLVMSATLDTDGVSRLLGGAPVLSGQGTLYPVAIEYLPPASPQTPLQQQVLMGIRQAWQQQSGDILVFLPGSGDIRRCHLLVRDQLPQAEILPLYSALSPGEQDRVFQPGDGRRRIILATPIAETSITIERIAAVVDSGYCRRPVYNNTTGLSRLTTMRISRASADQRAGRAGRLGPGTCYRLWSKAIDQGLLAHTPPEILHADLCPMALELALWGVHDPNQLRWLDPPRPTAWNSGVSLLQRLTLLDGQGRITPLGQNVAALPMHPRLGYMALQGKQRNCGFTACLLAAILEDQDLFRGNTDSADIRDRVQLLDELRGTNQVLPGHVDRNLCRRILQQAQRWHRLLGCPATECVEYQELGNLLAFAFPDRIAILRPDTSHRYQLANGKGAELEPADHLAGSRILVVPRIDSRQGDGRIFLAAAIDEQELRTDHPHLFCEQETVCWDEHHQRVRTSRDLLIDQVMVRSEPLDVATASEQISEVFLQGIQRSGCEELPWNRAARDLQARICSLRHWQGEQWPDLSDAALLQDLSWLAPYCQQMSRLSQLKELDLTTIFLSRLSWPQQQQLDALAPSRLPVPSGSRIRLHYHPGDAPVLAVRLQELFGLTDTPTICDGAVGLVVHLLSPANRPIQVTSDLRSFWHTTYPQIKKELAGRYPKHYWPDDPFTAVATARTKKGMRLHSGK